MPAVNRPTPDVRCVSNEGTLIDPGFTAGPDGTTVTAAGIQGHRPVIQKPAVRYAKNPILYEHRATMAGD